MDDNNNAIFDAIKERFANLPKDIQNAIISSGYQQMLFEISKKYKLSIEQMGALEMNTTMVMLGMIHPDKYYDELKDSLPTVPETDVKNLVNDVNEQILKGIREKLKTTYETEEAEEGAYVKGDYTKEDIDAGMSWEEKKKTVVQTPQIATPAPSIFPEAAIPKTPVVNDNSILEKSGINVEATPTFQSVKISNPNETLKVDSAFLQKSGIAVEENKNTFVPTSVPKENQADMLSGIENPPKAPASTFIANAMQGSVIAPKTETAYSIPSVNRKITPGASIVPEVTHHSNDQYREPV